MPKRWLPNPELVNWVYYQRQCQRKGKLSKSRFNKLEELGFAWEGQTSRPEWDEMFRRLQRYHDTHGCTPSQHDPVHGKLGVWIMTQRKAKRKGLLLQERSEKLESLGIEWEPYDALWAEKFGQLVEFKRKHGHCAVPVGWPENKSLAIWVKFQRRQKKANQLSEDRIKKLDSIGFIWIVGKGQRHRLQTD